MEKMRSSVGCHPICRHIRRLGLRDLHRLLARQVSTVLLEHARTCRACAARTSAARSMLPSERGGPRLYRLEEAQSGIVVLLKARWSRDGLHLEETDSPPHRSAERLQIRLTAQGPELVGDLEAARTWLHLAGRVFEFQERGRQGARPS